MIINFVGYLDANRWKNYVSIIFVIFFSLFLLFSIVFTCNAILSTLTIKSKQNVLFSFAWDINSQLIGIVFYVMVNVHSRVYSIKKKKKIQLDKLNWKPTILKARDAFNESHSFNCECTLFNLALVSNNLGEKKAKMIRLVQLNGGMFCV